MSSWRCPHTWNAPYLEPPPSRKVRHIRQECSLEREHAGPHRSLTNVIDANRDDPFEPVWDESQEGQEADRPEDLPVPANADKRYEEMDGG